MVKHLTSVALHYILPTRNSRTPTSIWVDDSYFGETMTNQDLYNITQHGNYFEQVVVLLNGIYYDLNQGYWDKNKQVIVLECGAIFDKNAGESSVDYAKSK